MTAQQAKESDMSFDDWVKGQGETVYHGTNQPIGFFDKEMLGKSTVTPASKE